ncbi:protein of unknown function DUF924 [Halothece sp. PCC 7418]|uniref:DUF924 family protein n=1 Tax=Halothece sp. (strain PCC 7418) TaxID=65093 RepID=UPI0002A08425|nr:DUF924 family protein [Halothece sp. PCC 7418]AFZ43754.1 protein of unknown function DUF924 [Halothece sp. PCC 7418]
MNNSQSTLSVEDQKQAQTVLDFWFGSPDDDHYGKPRQEWFIKNPEFDQQVRSRFWSLYEQAAQGKLDAWKHTPETCLALIILLDQFPRNLFRGDPRMFETDQKALSFAKYALKQDYDRQLLNVQRWFIYLPFEHSEDLEMQYRAISLFSRLKDDPDSESTIDYAERHLKVIEKFGRFPHRNAILGRESTPEEIAFLEQPRSSF